MIPASPEPEAASVLRKNRSAQLFLTVWQETPLTGGEEQRVSLDSTLGEQSAKSRAAIGHSSSRC
jgi:hypothetical protein